MTIRLLPLLSLFIMLGLAACDKEDDNPNSGGSGGGGGEPQSGEKTFRAKLNGANYVATSQDFIEGSSTGSAGVTVWSVGGLRTDFSTTESILITAISVDSTDFTAGSVFSSSNEFLQASSSGAYALNSSTEEIYAQVADDPIGPCQITITEVDRDAKTWSATFSFEAIDDDGITYSITEGEFENVPYE